MSFETTAAADANRIQKGLITLPATETFPACIIPETDLGSKSATFNFFTAEAAKNADLEGLENFLIIVINEEKVSNKDFSRTDGSLQKGNVSSATAHEFLDHELRWINGRNPKPTLVNKANEVLYQNKAIQAINQTTGCKIKQRDGGDY